jgi:hypothetical protein
LAKSGVDQRRLIGPAEPIRFGRTYPPTRLVSQSSVRHNFCIQTPNWVNQNSLSIISTRTSQWCYQTKHLRLFVKILYLCYNVSL